MALFAVSVAVLNILIAFGQRGGETFFSNPWLALAGLSAALSGVTAGVAALVAVILRGERSILVFAVLVVGLFVIGESTVPRRVSARAACSYLRVEMD